MPGTYGLTSVPIVFWMVVVALSVERRITLHRRALWIEYVTVGWNVVEAVVAIGAGVIAGSVALIGFGADSAIEVISAAGLLWRLRKAGPHATVSEEGAPEKRALYVVALTFFLLAIYITWEAVKSLISREEPLTSPVGIIVAVLSLAVMPTLAFVKQRRYARIAAGLYCPPCVRPWRDEPLPSAIVDRYYLSAAGAEGRRRRRAPRGWLLVA